jgi:hypothetical protein
MKRLFLSLAFGAVLTSSALAVSVGEIIRICGDDSAKYCQGVGYGDPMQACLEANFGKLSETCKLVVDRIRNGERVSLF